MADNSEKNTIVWLQTRRRSADPTAQRRNIARNRVLHDLPARGLARGRYGRAHLLRAGVSMALAVALAFVAVLGASASALPGEALFAVKIGVEDVRLALESDGGGRSALLAGFIEVRLDELERLASAGDESGLNVSAGRLERQLELADAGERSAALEAAIAHSQIVVQAIQSEIPDSALPGLQRALEAVELPAATGTVPATPTATPTQVVESVQLPDISNSENETGEADGDPTRPAEPTEVSLVDPPTNQPGNSQSAGGPAVTPPGQGGSVPGQGNPGTPATGNGQNVETGINGNGNSSAETANGNSSAGGQTPDHANKGGNEPENALEDPGRGKKDKDE